MPKEHARLSPSAIRWLTCPASPDAELAMPPNAASRAAMVGTDLHAHMELALRLNAHAIDWLPNPEHRRQVQLVVNTIRGLMRPHRDARLFVEERLGPPHWRPQGDLFGTGDGIILADRLLAIVDAKFGTHAVEATSVQLKIYLSLAVERFGPRPLMLTVVVQPRLGRKIRIAAWSQREVTTFTAELQRAAAATDDPTAPRRANDHCWFCRARPTCPEIIALETRRAVNELDAAVQGSL
jgi:hypothetical protein